MSDQPNDKVFWGLFEKLSLTESPTLKKTSIYEGFYASFYDMTTYGYAPDAKEYLDLAAAHPGPVLDVGCGTGRILVRLAQRGDTVVGIDNAPDMLRIMAAHVATLPPEAQARVRIVEGDATAFEFEQKFSLILVSAFTYLTTREAQLQFFRRAKEHLADGGCLAFDFLHFSDENVDAMDGHLSCVEVPAREGAMMTVFGTKFSQDRRRWWWNFYTQQTQPGGQTRQFLGSSTFARHDELELERTLEEAGFIVAEKRKTPQPMGNTVATRALYICEPRGAVKYPLWHPYLPMNHAAEQVKVLVEGHGCKVRDDRGREYIDASGGLWSTQCGLGQPEIIEAVHEQLRRLSYGTLFALRSNEPAIELSRRLVELAPGALTRAYLTCSGSESVELAMKLSRLYFHLRGQPEKHEIVYLDESYHGTYYGSMGVTGLYVQKERLAPHLPGLSSVAAPHPNRCPAGESFESYSLRCAAELEQRIVERGGKVAAFIMEPVLGSAGVVVPPQEYFDAVQRICRKHDVLLLLDEVATGFGRTGSWFAAERFGLRPDMLLLSKGINSGYLPLGAVLFGEQIARELLGKQVGIGHGSSANGNPACCAAALATLRVIERDGLIERGAQIGDYFRARLERLRQYPSVRDVRGLGLMLAVELAQEQGGGPAPLSPAQLGAVYEAMMDGGILPYPFASGFSFLPALTITREEVDAIADRLETILAGTVFRDGTVERLADSELLATPAG